jgi:small subunit ribosomal protein S7
MITSLCRTGFMCIYVMQHIKPAQYSTHNKPNQIDAIISCAGCLQQQRKLLSSIVHMHLVCSLSYRSHRMTHTRANRTEYASVESIVYTNTLNTSQSLSLHKMITICMTHGNKSKSNVIITNTLYRLAKRGNALSLLMAAINNVKPVLEVRKVRISGSTQLVPSIVSKHRQHSLAVRWILEAALKRRNTRANLSVDECLFTEIIDAFNKVGVARKKRDELHRLAEANRGFSHYRWW